MPTAFVQPQPGPPSVTNWRPTSVEPSFDEYQIVPGHFFNLNFSMILPWTASLSVLNKFCLTHLVICHFQTLLTCLRLSLLPSGLANCAPACFRPPFALPLRLACRLVAHSAVEMCTLRPLFSVIQMISFTAA
ncbi:unnamed protein product [Protopolystoma xenopodis]|uniref:Uncharacterized protein n=1 Tax=Protopolystoma xenopodis TaxID=117903 RepID=A0A3S5CF94_9PLAT|nr:unnamed protein product [Protopolystoma xenopodis]